jgi:hypothetical protein
MVAETDTYNLTELTKGMAEVVDLTLKIYSVAPDIIPSILEPFVFLPKDQIWDKLHDYIYSFEESKRHAVSHNLESAVGTFKKLVLDYEERIKSRQQPVDVPRREGSRPIKQFKTRKSEW